MVAAELAGIPTHYGATVDREYLHFVESHLVDHAGAAMPSIRPVGSSTVEITTTVAIHAHLEAKQQAIAAHRSQIGADPWLGVADAFGDVYGYEWYVRTGPAGPIDDLPSRPTLPVDRTAVPGEPSPLSAGELADIARGLATAVRYSDLGHDLETDESDRSWWRLIATDQYDAWLIRWPEGGAVTPHDHGGSAGAFAVVEGTLTEVVFESDGEHRYRFGPGDARGVPARAVHDVVNELPGTATSVHVYSPPLASMSYYDRALVARRVEAVDPEPAVWSLPDRTRT